MRSLQCSCSLAIGLATVLGCAIPAHGPSHQSDRRAPDVRLTVFNWSPHDVEIVGERPPAHVVLGIVAARDSAAFSVPRGFLSAHELHLVVRHPGHPTDDYYPDPVPVALGQRAVLQIESLMELSTLAVY